MIRALLPLLFLYGCNDDGGDIFDGVTDEDGDGYTADEDCEDDEPAINPGADERCDEDDEDEDCSGAADEEDPGVVDGFTMFPDADGDGWGKKGGAVVVCEALAGYVRTGGDCDDADILINPDAIEACDAEDVDEDCDGGADDADPEGASGQTSLWPDDDGDGFGAGLAVGFCELPETGYVVDATDCDDTLDFVYPDAAEVCDGIDDDCDGLSDEATALDASTWYVDLDGDGWGDADGSRTACEQPDGFVTDDTDCDDRSIGVYPGAPEFCDGEDDNCDGTVDEDDAEDVATWYEDADRDGYGDETSTSTDCDQPSGYVSNADDCDDSAAGTSPGDTEICDSADVDEDCDGLADDDDTSTSSTGMTRWYVDADGDGYGDADDSELLCETVSGYVSNDDDCDDTDATISPAATEVCDSANTDEDCDDLADDSDSSVSASGKTTYYVDADRDGYGLSTSTAARCDVAAGYSTLSTDCDDTSAGTSPADTEVCDGSDTDEDCDGLADDDDSSTLGSSKVTFYADADGDGYGTSAVTSLRCDTATGYSDVSGDCDESDAGVSPAAVEVCFDSVDEDCDGVTACDGTAADADRRLLAENAGDYVGWSVATAFDENNDGIEDLLIGAPFGDHGGTDAGNAYIVTTAGTGDLGLGSADAVLFGEDTSDWFGFAVAGVGDVNSDSRDDFVVGAPYDDDGGVSAGIVYLFRGRITGNVDAALAYAEFVGESASDLAGMAVAGVGDVDGNGTSDVFVGAPGRSSSTGSVYLFTTISSGTTDCSSAGAILTGESASDSAGTSIDGAGDVNGDGYDDLLVGAVGDDDAASNAGAAYLILGPQTGTASLSAADAKRGGLAADDVAGTVVAGAGDLDDDGYDDVFIGAPGYGSYGSVYIEFGPITGTTTLSGAGARIDGIAGTFGDLAAGGGDFDGDGYDDLVVGDSDNDTGAADAGAVYAFLGPFSGTLTASDAHVTLTGAAAGDAFGRSVAFIGAQDGTAGVSDLLVGAFFEDTSGTSAGAAYTFSSSGL